MIATLLAAAPIAVAGVALLGLAAWRPAAGCAVLALLVPLTGGIARNTLIPFLRPSEALAVVVLVGLALNLTSRRRRLVFTGLDLVVLVFVLVEVLIPFLMLLVRQVSVDLETWRTVMGPFQYLAVYLLFSRCEPNARELRWIINLAFVASMVVAGVALAELLSSSVHDFVSTYYQESPTASWDPVYRPSSLVTHYSAVGGFAFITGSLALALAIARHPGFPGPWLAVVVLANAVGLMVSQTWAPLVALPIVCVAVFMHAGRAPWRAILVLAGLAGACAILFWPLLSDRIDQQQIFSGSGGGIALPQTMDTRVRYWQEFFLPAAVDNFWLGTGTSTVAGGYPTPSEVPERLNKFVDNEYLYEVLRAGIFALVLLLVVFFAVARAGWRTRSSPDPLARALGATCLAAVLALIITGFTSEYLTFSALTQLFWMLIGLMVAVRGDPTIVDAPAPAWPAPRAAALREAPAGGV